MQGMFLDVLVVRAILVCWNRGERR